MEITVRTLLASVAASAVFGGAMGALATAATSGQASPQAIAAAVQRVSDRAAQADLLGIHVEMFSIEGRQDELKKVAEEIEKNTHQTCENDATLVIHSGGGFSRC